MPRKIQKQWKNTYHLIRKTIYLAKNNPQWQTHPIIETLKNHNHTIIPPLPNQEPLRQEWLINIATIAKTTNSHDRAITTKYTRDCIKKNDIQIHATIRKKSKENIQKIFNNHDTPPLDCITDTNNNILTNPTDIANEIHIQQTISNSPTVPTCYHQREHIPECTCGVRQYPWHDIDGFVIDKRGNPQTHHYTNTLTKKHITSA